MTLSFLLAAIITGTAWYKRYSSRAARREYAAYHKWVRGGGR